MANRVNTSRYFVFWGVAALVYVVLTLTAPLVGNTYHLNTTQIGLLQLTVMIPIILVWWAAVYGAVRIKVYSANISHSRDGAAMNHISNGLAVLVVGLIVSQLFSSLRPYAIIYHWEVLFAWVNTYLQIVFPLLAFYFMYRGSLLLLEIVKQERAVLRWHLLTAAGFSALASLYTWAILSNQYRNHTPDPSKFNSFFMPDLLILLTVVTPYLLLWMLGILTVINVRRYQSLTKGVIYRRALTSFTAGLFLVVIFSIAIQLLASLAPSLAHWNLSGILLLIYLVIVFFGAGYILIAVGARQLSKIEEAR